MGDDSLPAGPSLPDLFNEWKIEGEILHNFIEHGINVDLLKYLTETDLKELCPPMAQRIVIRNKICESLKNIDSTSSIVVDEQSEDLGPNHGNDELYSDDGPSNIKLLPEEGLESSNESNKSSNSSRIVFSTLSCAECNYSSSNFTRYIQHLESIHQIKNYFACPIHNCWRTYHTKYSLQYHLAKRHPTPKIKLMNHPTSEGITNLKCEPTNFEGQSCNPNSAGMHSCENTKQSFLTHPSKDLVQLDFKSIFFSKIEEYVSYLYDMLNIPRSSIQMLFSLMQSLVNSFTNEITVILCEPGRDEKNKYDKIMSAIEGIKEAFDTLNSDYKRTKHFSSSSYYIAPESVSIGTVTKEKIIENKVIITVKEKFAYIVPLNKSLKCFLELPRVFTSIMNYQKKLLLENKNTTNTILRNIIQGSLWKDISKKYDENQILMPLTIFYDDLETGNPLGSRAGKNKLGAVYTSIATIPPNMSSRLENIFLSLLFYSKDRSNFGNKSIFNKLILDLKNLEKYGLDIDVENGTFNVKFVTVTMAGDNLGLNSILGFFESFNSTHFCRICLTNKTESRTQIVENSNDIRKIENYETDVKKQINIKESCIWNDIPNFHVYKNWSIDVMHDLMEGVHRYSMALIIGHLKKKYFTVEELNSRIKYFLYGDSDTVIPPITNAHLKNKYIIISASEMLCLVRNFCFIIGDLIKVNDDIWEYYLLLLEMTEILTSQTFTNQSLEYLENLISEHHQKFQDVFHETLKPKFHLLLHYPRIIRTVGPPILISSFKDESKHREIKKVCNSTTSRRQLPLSAAIRCQWKACCRFFSRRGMNNCITYSNISHQTDISKTEFSVDWYEINGIKYKINTVIVYNFDEFDEPIFYLIEDIYVNRADNNIVTCRCILLNTIDFNPHFRAYNVLKSTEIKTCTIKECNSVPLILHNVDSKLFVSLVKM